MKSNKPSLGCVAVLAVFVVVAMLASAGVAFGDERRTVSIERSSVGTNFATAAAVKTFSKSITVERSRAVRLPVEAVRRAEAIVIERPLVLGRRVLTRSCRRGGCG